MRVADAQVYTGIVARLSTAQSRMLVASNRASNGQRMQLPSDDPVASAHLVRIRSSLSKATEYRSAIRAVRGDLDSAESVLASAEELMIRVHEIALQGANGAMTPEARSALAVEVRHIREQVLSIANTKGTQGYLFAGTQIDTPPFTAAGVFVGNDLPRVLEVAPGEVATINVSGALAFTALGGRDVLADLAALESALSTNNQASIAASVGSIDACRRQILAARIDGGLKADRMAVADLTHEQAQLLLSQEQHDVAEIDPAEAYTRLAEARNQLEQSFAASRSLLDTFGRSRFG